MRDVRAQALDGAIDQRDGQLVSHAFGDVDRRIAVQVGQTGQFVFVVKPDMTVESRAVVPGLVVDDSVVIDQGLAAGETVVTEGQLRLVPGTKVQVPAS